MTKIHYYQIALRWDGNLGQGTQHYRAYSRDYIVAAINKPTLLGSSDTSFRGDAQRWNPEEMLLSALSACHQLWYLHFCSVNHINVLQYEDQASAEMLEHASGAGEFRVVRLKPNVLIDQHSDPQLAYQLHEKAHEFCFIARSVNFNVTLQPHIRQHTDID
ncbi:OsmC family protein [Acinetobacter larvae]|uniref:Peroxiredoxin n=1 Tax=Acinetobacter larvae TaxID=1789224 RepID=A0A1B2LW51_9GAMM|nr:OsmC family protein [Acinetobacter larvae]AOA57155.1 peroxiredoxin [Acinetobacter larvae]